MLHVAVQGQSFKRFPSEAISTAHKKIEFREIFTISSGEMLIMANVGFAEFNGESIGFSFPGGGRLTDANGDPQKLGQGSNFFKDVSELYPGCKSIAEGPGQILYFVTDNNNLGWADYSKGRGFGMPPFNFPGKQKIDIRKIWLDRDGDLFIAAGDMVYIISESTKLFEPTKHADPNTQTLAFLTEFDKDSNMIVTRGAKKIQRFSLGKNVLPLCFAEDLSEPGIYIGTNNGLYEFDKKTGTYFNLFNSFKQKPITITHIEAGQLSSYIWFSTIENGMGSFSGFSKAANYYPYKNDGSHINPIGSFTRLSSRELLVAPYDSLPAIFNTEMMSYEFINDTSFRGTKNNTSDIKTGIGNLTLMVKDGELYISKDFLKKRDVKNIKYPAAPYIKEILIQGLSYQVKTNDYSRYDSIKSIRLKYHENKIDIFYAIRGFNSTDTVVYAYKMDGYWNEWKEVPFSFLDERMNMTSFEQLKPGTYIFRVKAKNGKGPWLDKQVALTIIIEPPFWQTWWFWASIISGISLLVFLIVRWRVRAAREHEREKLKHEKELLEMEARALRAQMNPHFIFNCLNSIKALILSNDQQRSVDYLTTFSKLIRTLFHNSDKRQISLYDEIETCKLYTQLEAMRLNDKFHYNFEIDSGIDLKSVMVPALIIQPFIENAIWHGIVPKERGMITVSIYGNDESVTCEVEDDGIGRTLSTQNKPLTPIVHDSKGIHLSQARLNLEKLLNDKNASISIIDKYENLVPMGTKVIIEFNLH